MQQEVYADLLFLINFSMDFLCFFLTARILRRRLRPLLAVIASVIGGIYSVAALFIPFGTITALFADAAVCAIMCAIAFAAPARRLRRFISEFLVYLACATALGGIMTALFNLLNRLDLPINSGGNEISSWLFLLLSIISGIAALKGSNFLRKTPSTKTVEAEIIFDNKRVIFHALTDTGNLLRDPASGKSVIVADVKTALPILPEAIQNAVTTGNIDSLSKLPSKYSNRIRIIPGSTVSGSKLLIGIIPDKILIHNESGTTDVSAVFAPASVPNLPDGCNAILPGELNI